VNSFHYSSSYRRSETFSVNTGLLNQDTSAQSALTFTKRNRPISLQIRVLRLSQTTGLPDSCPSTMSF